MRCAWEGMRGYSLVTAALLAAVLALAACGTDSETTGTIDTPAQARAEIAGAISSGETDAQASDDASPAVKRMVSRAHRIERIHAIAGRSRYVGWICDGLDLYRDDELLLEPSSSEVQIAMIDSDRYSVSERAYAKQVLDALGPGSRNPVTISEATKLFDELEGGMCKRLGPTTDPNPVIR